MTFKIKNIIMDFWKSTKKGEKMKIFLIPALATVFLLLIFKKINSTDITKFAVQFTDDVLTIAALLSAFGIASVSIIMTSENRNLDIAKKTYFKDRENADNIPINYYQFILIKNYYNIVVQIILLLFGIFSKFIVCKKTALIIIIIELFLLFHAILIQILVLCTMYYLVWKDKIDYKG